MPLSQRENVLRAIEFRNPEWVPVWPAILPAAWHKYREDLEGILLRHPKVFGAYEKGSTDFDDFPPTYRQEYFKDNWECLWYTIQAGMEGQVVEHPLADWGALETYRAPDPLVKGEFEDWDWHSIGNEVRERREKGLLTKGYGERLFDLLYNLRGFENLMLDLATDHPRLPELIEIVSNQKMALTSKWLQIGVDMIWFHGDIGTQRGLMISPETFRRHIKPMYKMLFMACRKVGTHVWYSSDGNLLEIVDDLIECGVSVHDPQVRANTLEGIAKAYKGKMCVAIDLDQQKILPFGGPAEVEEHVREVVERIDSPEGGFMIYAEIQPTYPLENIEALCEALEKYCLSGKPSEM